MPEGLVNHKELPNVRNDRYHPEWDEISPKTEVPGLEGAEDFTPEGAAKRSLELFGQVGMVGNQPLWAKGGIPASPTHVSLPSIPAWALPACLLVHAEAPVTPGPGQRGAAAEKTSEFHS